MSRRMPSERRRPWPDRRLRPGGASGTGGPRGSAWALARVGALRCISPSVSAFGSAPPIALRSSRPVAPGAIWSSASRGSGTPPGAWASRASVLFADILLASPKPRRRRAATGFLLLARSATGGGAAFRSWRAASRGDRRASLSARRIAPPDPPDPEPGPPGMGSDRRDAMAEADAEPSPTVRPRHRAWSSSGLPRARRDAAGAARSPGDARADGEPPTAQHRPRPTASVAPRDSRRRERRSFRRPAY